MQPNTSESQLNALLLLPAIQRVELSHEVIHPGPRVLHRFCRQSRRVHAARHLHHQPQACEVCNVYEWCADEMLQRNHKCRSGRVAWDLLHGTSDPLRPDLCQNTTSQQRRNHHVSRYSVQQHSKDEKVEMDLLQQDVLINTQLR